MAKSETLFDVEYVVADGVLPDGVEFALIPRQAIHSVVRYVLPGETPQCRIDTGAAMFSESYCLGISLATPHLE